MSPRLNGNILRGKDRRRQHVDAALLDAQVAMLANLGLTGEAERVRAGPAMRTRTSCRTRCLKWQSTGAGR
jgi:hypothetical protein